MSSTDLATATTAAGTARRLPLLLGQSGIWFDLQLGTAAEQYNVGLYTDIRGPLDLRDFRAAASLGVAETEALRVRFAAGTEESGPYQEVGGPEDDWTLTLIEAADEDEAHAWMHADLHRSMDVTRDPLFTFALISLSAERHFFYQRAHHLTLDGHSNALVLRRIAEIYTALCEGRDTTEGALPGLAELHSAQAAYRASERYTVDRAHWAERLLGLPDPTTLSLGERAVRTAGAEPLCCAGSVAPGTLERLTATARLARTNWATGLIAAVVAYLHRMTGQEEILLSLPVANRTTAMEKRAPGMTANVLPLRVDVGRAVTVRSLIRQTLDETRQTLRHQQYRYEEVLHDLRGESHAAGAGGSGANRQFGPVVNVLGFDLDVSFADSPGTVHRLPSGNVEDVEFSVYPVPGEGGLQLQLVANPGRYNDAELGAHQRRFAAFLAAFADHPDTEIADLPLLLPGERERLLGEWNDTAVEVAPGTVHGLVESRVAVAPERTALVFGAERLSYGELNARANRVAHGLIARGVGPESVVGVALPRSDRMVVAVLGVLKAGAAYLPVDLGYPAERRQYMLDNARVACVVDESNIAQIAEGQPEDNPLVGVDPGCAAYVIYTSGSTGRPKGVVVAHAGVVNRLEWMRAEYGLGSGDRVLHKTPIGFDVSVWELFGTLSQGATLVIAEPEGHKDPVYLRDLITQQGVTTAHFVPSMLQVFLDEPDVKRCDSALRRVICSGEALPPETRDAFFRTLGRTELHNLYGPTEASIDVTFTRCHPGVDVTIGGPVWNTRVYVLDGDLQPVPVGTPGDLYLAGVQLARGYAHRPDLTADAFMPDPYGVAGTRMYATGDVAAWTPEGNLRYLGRSDNQVKIRGQRVELGEIQTALATLSGVSQATVLVHDGRLIAYYVAEAGTAPDFAVLRDRLPDHMVPTTFIELDAFPLTPNGKLDRKALPIPERRGSVTSRPPRNAREESLAALFAEVLGIDTPVGIDDNFFTLGGHSLLATRLTSRIRTTLGTELPLRAVFEAPTVALLGERMQDAGDHRPPLVAHRDRPEHTPLSHAQRRLWFLNQLEGGSPTYHMPLAVRLHGDLDADALEAALNDLTTRHESLCTVFDEHDGEPEQKVLQGAEAVTVMERVTLSEGELTDRLASAAVQAFDLAVDLPLRAVLFTIGESEHVLLLVLHHIAGDGWSFAPLARDLSTAYQARCQGTSPRWQPLPVQYADYSLWQHELLGDEHDPDSRAARQLDYWSNQLADLPAELALPREGSRPRRPGHLGDSVAWQLPASVRQGLERLARESGASLFMVVQSALAGLLTRLGAGNDIPIGVPIAGRTDEALNDLVGCFLNTLVLRNDTSDNPSFRTLLHRTRETNLHAYTHQDIPFEHLVEVLNPERSPGRHPLFQVLLNFEESWLSSAFVLPGTEARAEAVSVGAAKFDLAFHVVTADDGELYGTVDFATDLFARATVQGMTERFARFLTAVAADPDRPLAEYQILADEERRRLLGEWNDTAVEVAPGTVHGLVESRVAVAPERTALVFGAERLSYGELNARANRVAHGLIARGVGPESVVGVALPRSDRMVVALLGVLKAGAAYLPVDLDYPAERRQYMLDNARVACVVDESNIAQIAEGQPEDNPLVGVDPGCAAYVIYTSGSTGRPKGVVVAHAGVVNRLEWMRAEYGLGSGDRVLHKTPIGFDVSVWELFGTLSQGATLVIAEPEGHKDPAYLARLISQEQVTTTHFVPSMLQVFLDEPDVKRCDSTLRRVICSGEALPPETRDAFFRTLGRTELHNLYGPTEASIDVTFTRCHPGVDVTIGGPVWNTRVYVLDGDLQPVPVGTPGDLYLAGVQLARGYAHRPDLTADAFMPDPYGVAGTRMYATGDVAAWTPEGNLRYLGRSDNQVKIRGQRVELGEIQTALATLSGVSQATVLVHDDRLIAYYVAEAGTAPDFAVLRDRLPDHMVPTTFIELDAFPLTPNGKLDRKALPIPERRGSVTSRPPRNAREESLAALFAEVLGIDTPVGIDDNFFTLGGHSLLATRLTSRIRTTLGTELPLRAVFEAPTVALLGERMQDAGDQRPPLVAHRDRPEHTPLSHAQRRLWFLNKMDQSGSAYTMPAVLRLTGPLDAEALSAALGDVVERHESLRTVVQEHGGEPVQVIREHDAGRNVLEMVAADGSALDRLIMEYGHRPFDLAAELPLRAVLFAIGESEHVLLLVLHHIAGDGWSFAPLARDLSTAYQARCQGGSPRWQPLPVQYADYSLWQHELLGDEHDPDSRAARQLDYWQTQLADLPTELNLPTDRPRTAITTRAEGVSRWQVGVDLLGMLDPLIRESGASLFMVVQAGLAGLLTRLGAGNDIPIGVPIAGRTDEALNDLVGCFLNTLVLRNDTSDNPSFRTLLHRTRETNLHAYTHQDIPFEHLVEVLNPERSLTRHPLFQVALNFQNNTEAVLELPHIATATEPVPGLTAKFDLSFTIRNAADGSIDGTIEYNRDLFDQATADLFGQRLVRLLEAAAERPDEPLSQHPLLTTEEHHQLLEEWNDTGVEVAGPGTLHELFEERVGATPDACAVVFQGLRLSYGELNARANRVAHGLIARGVGPESVVGVALSRSDRMVVALLGVLKAGAAYLPVDLGYPAERRQYMLDNARVACVVDEHVLSTLMIGQPEDNPLVGVDPGCAAYVIYTSGSTGRPKGVVVAHAGVVNRLEWMRAEYGLGSGDRVLHKTPVGFDVSVWELFGTLSQGATLVIAEPEGHKDPAYLARLISREQVTTTHFVPSMLQVFLNELDTDTRCSLRRVLCSGEALSPETRDTFFRTLADVELHNLYGPTEASIEVTHTPCHPGVDVTIGRPVWNTRVYVLDGDLQPVPVGTPGDLYLAGVQLARGYAHRPDLTADAFIPDPHGIAGTRMYATGDVAAWTPDGNLRYLGRSDNQVKIRGQRVELGEIQTALAALAGISQATVLVHNDRLIAYYVSEAGTAPDFAVLRDRLPDHMVPTTYVQLDVLPLTPNGKLDRKALPIPEQRSSVTFRPPRNAREETLTALFAQVLGINTPVGIDDNFFTLGGHSLLAVSLVERLRERGVSIDVRTLFSTPTVAGLATATGRSEVTVPPNLIPADALTITPDMLPLVDLSREEVAAMLAQVPGGVSNIADVYPLAPLQEGILFHHLMAADRGDDVYVLPVVLRFDSLDRFERFRSALQRVVDRHDILRTAVLWEGLREPVQVVLRHAEVPVTTIRPEREDAVHAETAGGVLSDWLLTACPSVMDLREAPLVRLHVTESDEGQQLYALLQIHHLIQDHTALAVVLDEVRAVLDSREHELPAPLPFRDVVAQARLGMSQEEHQAYFTALLGDVTEPTAPYGVVEIHGDGSDIAEASVPLDATLAGRLREQARRHGVSPATLFHVIWSRVTAATSGRDDVVFGTVLFGRMQAGAGSDRVPGLFINTLPVRMRSGSVTVAEAVSGMRDQLGALVVHEHAPLSLAQQVSGVPARTPLFTSLLNYRHSTSLETSGAGTALEGIEVLQSHERTNYPVTISVDDSGDAFTITAQTVTSIDSQAMCEQVSTAAEQLVEALEGDPDAHLHRVGVLDGAKRRRLLEEWNDTGVEVAGPGTLHELFEERVGATPDACAVVFQGLRLSYGELNARANRVAHGLIARGVGPESVVGVALSRSDRMVVALLGVLKAGAAYLPVDLGYPAERRQYMLDNARVACVVDEQVLSTLMIGQPEDNPLVGVDPGCAAYVIYTSGSTGRPKGVVVAHAGVVNRLEWMRAEYGLGSGDRVLHKTPVGFDVSVWELFGTLSQGATLVIAEPEGHKDPAYLARLISQEQVTTTHFVPSMLQVFLDEPDAQRCDSALRRVICSGEALPPETRDTFFRTLADVELHNLYGPTEASIDVTFTRCHPGVDVTIGGPVWNTRVYVLDGDLQPVPVGTPGDLYLAGVQLARGYAHRPDLTADAFMPDPYGVAGTRMYATGDVAAWTPEGNLRYLGRSDNQVKIRGQRVELGEIQTALATLSGVSQATVLVHDGRLIAYYVAEADTAPDFAVLHDRLPDHMVPTTYVQLETLPLTPNGKLDRKALPIPERRGSVTSRPPRNAREESLAALFAEVLGIDTPVGIDDNFFTLGGHSLLATRLTSRIRTTLGTELPLRAVFEAPTVALLGERMQDAGDQRPPLVAHRDRPEHTPLSHAQRRLWFLNQLEGGSPTYHMPLAVRLHGDLDADALEAALNDLTTRHESLCTVFDEHDGEPEQKVLQGAEAVTVMERVTLSEGELTDRLASAAVQAFDLAVDLPLRAVLFTIGESEHVLLLVLHHIAGDGWSFAPLARDLSTAYQARCQGTSPRWQPLPVQYADYSLWQHELLGDEHNPDSRAARQLDYWQTQLADLPTELNLPTDRPRPAIAGHRGGISYWNVDAELMNRLESLARESGASLFMVVQAGLAGLLTRLGAGNDIPIGVPIAGRTDEALNDLVGCFLNTLVLRSDTSDNPSFRTLLHRTRETNLHAYTHQDIPFEHLVEVLNPERSLTRHPLFQVALNFQNNTEAVLDLADGTTVRQVEVSAGHAKFDLSFTLRNAPEGGLLGAIEYATDLFDQDTVDLLGQRLLRLLDAAAERPDELLSQHALLTSEEQHQLLEEWNGGTPPETAPETLHHLFERQAGATPDHVALVHGDDQLTYAELNARANRLAHRLIADGAGPHTVVAVSLPRSLELIVALLGVLKSGAAYLPVDPEYPAERVAFMLEDVKSVALLDDGELVRAPGEWPATDPVAPADAAAAARLPSYVIYTSGSTGRPKGVVIRHDAVVHYLAYLHELTGLDAGDTVLNLASVSFDPSVRDIFGPLTAGARLVVAKPEEAKDPAALLGLLRRHRVTVLPALVPTMLDALSDAARDAAGENDVPSPWLRMGLVSGEELTASHVWRAAAVGTHWRLVNQYGPTESTMTATFHPVTEADAREGARLPIGRPIPGARCYVLDEWLQPMPVGSTGELYLAGDDLADGYVNSPGLTAQRFVADPYGSRPGSRMYRTGDIARWRADGTLEFHGRADDQVKLRGIRVELGEIQAVLAAVDGVAQAGVVVREDVPGRQLLTGYVVPDAGAEPTADTLRRALEERLPAHMVPGAFVVLDALPLSPNGKLDRKALPAPQHTDGEGREPSTPVEKALAELFCDVLRLDRVGADDNFFTLGGHSLLAARLVSRVHAVLGVELHLRSLFQAPTVAALAALVERDDGADNSLDGLLPIRAQGTGTPLFCVHPVGGLSWCYARLVPYLGDEFPVYGLQARGIAADGQCPARTIEEMADDYVEQIRRVQPRGPYRLLGWSVGGNVAHAIAVRLRRLGEPVDLVALLDSCPSDLMDKPTRAMERERLHKVVADFDLDAADIEWFESDDSEFGRTLRKELSVMKGMSREQISAMWDTSLNTSLILRDYRPERLDVALLYFTALLERPPGSPDVTAWEPYSGGPIEEYGIESSHGGMMDAAPVAAIGRVLGDVLRRIEGAR